MDMQLMRKLGYGSGMVLPYGVFFKGNSKFLEQVSQWNNPLIEMGSGTGYNIKLMKDHGNLGDFDHLKHCRGFDINYRDEYDHDVQYADATDCPFYHKTFTIMVCRPDHSGWFGELYEQFQSGEKDCKRLVYVGLERNFDQDLPYRAIHDAAGCIKDVGSEGEWMFWWEFKNSGV